MIEHHFLRFPADEGKGATGAPAGWRVTAGNPVARGVRHYTADDGSLLSGFWECTPGTFHVTYDKWEFCHMISGRCTVTPDGGAPIELRPGDGFVLEAGFTGTWEVQETMTKHFVFKIDPK
ncbi:cupin domain-containing protein [Zavarzinia sp.]|uniref:cupin domain-containing protein n=1 Tax=Zavarzinia sp. TaxID=2027920 RepID=UPI0035645AEB